MTLDLVTVGTAAVLLLSRPSARLAHPAILYLIFHVYVVTWRGWAINLGASTFLGVDPSAVARAVLVADGFLAAATLGWLLAENRAPVALDKVTRRAPVNPRTVRWVAVLAIPAGLFSLLSQGYVPGVGVGDATFTTSYQTVAILWPALALIAFIHIRGFRALLVGPLALYLGVLALQGHSRFRFAIPLIMLLLIYLHQQGRRWPPLKLWVPALLLMALFVPLKGIGTEVRAGTASLDSIGTTIEDSTREVLQGTNSEQALLDQAAIAIMLADRQELTFEGRPYLAVFTLPVPRPMWSGKPGLADHLKELATPTYPIAEIGAITTISGDLYLNFRWWGVLLGALLLAIVSGNVFRVARVSDRRSAYFFGYALLAASLVQVSRDGLISLVMFTVVHGLPWVAIWYLSIRRVRVDEARELRSRPMRVARR